MHRNHHFFCYQSVLRPEKPICLKMQICIERFGENAIFMHLDAIIPDIRSFGEPENIRRTFRTQIIDDFPAVWNCGRLSAKFFISSVNVIDTVGFLSFFNVLLEQLMN